MFKLSIGLAGLLVISISTNIVLLTKLDKAKVELQTAINNQAVLERTNHTRPKPTDNRRFRKRKENPTSNSESKHSIYSITSTSHQTKKQVC